MVTHADEKYMKRALYLAQRGGIRVRPNPLVGAVLVKNDCVIGTGYHQYYGGPHAEIYALKKAQRNAKRSTLYVTLEPCNHTGKRPPCSEAIISAGITTVYIAMKDPNPVVSGKGIQKLKKAGINVTVGLCENQAKEINKVYIKNILKNEPFVILKMAQTVDGKTASKTGDSKWISDTLSRNLVHQWRSESEAVMVGAQTVKHDNPSLTSHGKGRNPIRIIIDQKNCIKKSPYIFDNKVKTIIISKNTSPFKLAYKGNRFNLKHIIKNLYKLGIYQLIVEGGGSLNASALEDGIVDEIRFFISPKLLGGRDALTAVEGNGITRIRNAVKISHMTHEQIGSDILITGRIGG
ncbi:MAG: bifunctional diaminohydroxyphosphoribosylaminopyrimidine deaminase/5-amino-6-(5-phosphoribosylamino)uracil reductase RibD [bacterium]